MNNQDKLEYYKHVKVLLEVIKVQRINHCDKWKDSGDRGACYAQDVTPINNLIKQTERLLMELR